MAGEVKCSKVKVITGLPASPFPFPGIFHAFGRDVSLPASL